MITRKGHSIPGEGSSKAILISNLIKDCQIDVIKEFPKPKGFGHGTISVYGDWFEGGPSTGQPLMSYSEMKKKGVIQLYEDEIPFNIFCMTAPSCMG